MNDKKTRILWLRILITGLAIVVIVFLLLMLITTVYAFILAFKTRGAPDAELIGQFAEKLGMWLNPLVIIVLAYFGGTMVSRRAGNMYVLHGVSLGIVIALFSFLKTKIFGHSLDLTEGMYLLFYIIAAGLGGFKAIPKEK